MEAAVGEHDVDEEAGEEDEEEDEGGDAAVDGDAVCELAEALLEGRGVGLDLEGHHCAAVDGVSADGGDDGLAEARQQFGPGDEHAVRTLFTVGVLGADIEGGVVSTEIGEPLECR